MRDVLSMAALAAGVLVLGAGSAAAHVPSAVGGGFGAGFAHPLSGLDHLLAMLAVGLWAGQRSARVRWLLPAGFLAVMAAGAAAGAAGLGAVPLEAGIAASVLVLGALVALKASLPAAVTALVVGPFAALHGHAHGLEAAGAGLLATGAGFLAATALLIASGLVLGRLALPLATRTAGAGIAAAGVLLLVA